MATPFSVVFLEASVPLVKTITVNPDGTRDTSPYPHVKNFTSHTVVVSSLTEFYEAIRTHAQQGHCLYKGLLDRPLHSESRAGHTLTAEYTPWVCLDLDDYPAATVAEAMGQLGLAQVEHIVQHSASSGLGPGLRAHVFFQLATPKAPTLLKSWLIHKNLELDLPTELTASRVALKWPLDISTCQNDKLLYIAPPQLNTPDPIPERLSLVPGAEAYELPAFPQNTHERMLDKINDLRQEGGYRKRSALRTTPVGGVEVLKNPQPAVVTGAKTERGFTYLNLNGGDSWGYYYPEGRPELLHNFKGEPSYHLREIVPDYFIQLQAAPRAAQPVEDAPRDAEGIQRWVISDKLTSRYYKVAYDTQAKSVELLPAADRRRLLDYTMAYNLPEPDLVPDWEVVFDPTDPTPVDFDRSRINTFTPTKYWTGSHSGTVPNDPELAKPLVTLIHHVVGGCGDSMEAFLNWLAYLWQVGRKPQTAWVLHGRTGTGKGMLFEALRKLFGEHALSYTVDTLADRFTGPLARAQLVLLDEVDSDQIDSAHLAPKLRNLITEETLTIRRMKAEPASVPSYFGLIIAANLRNAAVITFDDRRYNIPPRQEVELKKAINVSTGAFRRTVLSDEALGAFATLLATMDVDEARVMTPLETDAKKAMQAASLSSPDHVVRALFEGDFSYFAMFLPPADDLTDIGPQLTAYREIVGRMYEDLSTVPFGQEVMIPLTRNELRTIFGYLVGWKTPPSKFMVSAARYGLTIEQDAIEYRGGQVIGTPFAFTMTPQAKTVYEALTRSTQKAKLYAMAGGKSA